MEFTESDKARFWAKVKKGKPTECWEWTGVRNNNGYGYISMGGRAGRRLLAHRIAWEILRGQICDGKCVLHNCDNPLCVNPNHLFLGSMSDNTQDMIAKGRWKKPPTHCGVNSPRSKLTEEQVLAIRADSRSHAAIAPAFGVGYSTIGRIIRGEAYKEVSHVNA